MTTPAAQRLNMVESQIRPSDVTDRRILRAFSEVERERFVPPQMAGIAYMDEAVPLGKPNGGAARLLMAPRPFAKLLQLAAIEPTDTVLILGTGLGYSAAIVARLAASVTAIECDETLAAAAKANLAGLSNVSVTTGPLVSPPAGGDQQFNVILVEGGLFERPDGLLARLKEGGSLLAILTERGVGRATQWTRTQGSYGESQFFEASAPPLPGFERSATFVF